MKDFLLSYLRGDSALFASEFSSFKGARDR
jgi:hypothetical protein